MLELENITDQASPSIRMWREDWAVKLDGKRIGVVRMLREGEWKPVAIFGRTKRYLELVSSRDDAAEAVRRFYVTETRS